LELLDKYSAYGSVMVNIVTFSTSAANPTGVWVSVDVAKDHHRQRPHELDQLR
jgi:hypothetical protein